MNLTEFPLNSDNLYIAFAEILLVLLTAAGIGWMLARLATHRKTRYLAEQIEDNKFELSQYKISVHHEMDRPIATNATKVVYPEASPDHEPDDLKVVDGIGLKIEEILNREGIHTYEQLAEASILRIAAILKKAGPRFQMHDPSSWPKQAEMARDKRWDELHAFQNI